LKNNLPFFSHDNDARNHPKFKALRARFGWAGVGRFWGLNEIISDAEDCRLDLRRAVIRASFASDLGLSDSEFDEFVAFLADPDQCGLIHFEDGIVTTDRTQDDLSRVAEKRKRDRNRIRQRKRDNRGRVVSENQKIAGDATTEQSRAEFIDDDGDSQNLIAANRGENGKFAGDSFTTADLRSALAKSAPRDLTISDQLLKDLTVRLAAAGLGIGYVAWYGDYVRRQPNLANPGGYFRAHFGELVDRYRASREKHAVVKPPLEEKRVDPEEIKKAFSGLPWRRPKDGEKVRDGPEELPTF